ncbi:hypothetical protein ACFQ07_28735 [Actinomadura adrarensis]|uniref:Uncharacterized protein n=1 Tax=Actinomadura adrarensis TaxID=1819600 RepID=A0ABW3CQQ5_9ACTN
MDSLIKGPPVESVQLVACVRPVSAGKHLKWCRYSQAVGEDVRFSLVQLKHSVTVHAAKTGAVLGSTTFVPGDRTCPGPGLSYDPDEEKTLYTDFTIDEIDAAVEKITKSR